MSEIKSTDMPAPDAVIVTPTGHRTVAMFFYAMPEGTDMRQVATENGFASMFVSMDDESMDGGEVAALWERYGDGADGEEICDLWQPDVPEGWTLAERYDTEDGPYAILIKKREAEK